MNTSIFYKIETDNDNKFYLSNSLKDVTQHRQFIQYWFPFNKNGIMIQFIIDRKYINRIIQNSILQFQQSPILGAMEIENNNQQQQVSDIQIPQSIIAEISTKLSPPYRLSSSITLDVSTQTDELALNDMIKKLLIDQQAQNQDEQENQNSKLLDNVVFDFLVADKLLRGNLKSHLIRYQITAQNIIKVEYFIAFENLQPGDNRDIADWVSALDSLEFLDDAGNSPQIIVAMYDGSIQIQNFMKISKKNPKSKGATFKVHDDPIKSIKVLQAPRENTYYLITGTLGEELKVTTYSKQSQSLFKIEAREQHQGSILSIDANPTLDGHFCTTGSSGTLTIWRIPEDFLDSENEVVIKGKKRKQLNYKKVKFVASQSFSSDSILCSKWATTEQVILGSSDHSIKLVDVQKMSEARSLATSDSVTTAIDFLGSRTLLLSCHEDGYLRGWDLRSNNNSPVYTFKSHTRYGSCVEHCPNSSNIFASGAYDSTVNIWDVRSVFPLQSINSQYDKILALKWRTEKCLVFGGSAPKVTYFQI